MLNYSQWVIENKSLENVDILYVQKGAIILSKSMFEKKTTKNA
jgi:hypothetical protein